MQNEPGVKGGSTPSIRPKESAFHKCPKCDTDMVASRRGIKVGSLIFGILLMFFTPVSLYLAPFVFIIALLFILNGINGKNKIILNCQACGHRMDKPRAYGNSGSGTTVNVVDDGRRADPAIKRRNNIIAAVVITIMVLAAVLPAILNS